MKKLMGVVGVLSVAAVAGYLTTAAWGQNGPSEPPTARVGLVDVAYIFENYAELARQKELFLGQREREQAKLSELENALKQGLEERNAFNPGSPEYQQRDDEITQEPAILEVQARQADKRLAQQESTVVHKVYMDMLEVINAVARQQKLTLVLQYRREEPMTPSNPREVRQGITRLVLYHDSSMDLTELVLKAMNNRYQQRMTGSSRAPARKGSAAQTSKQQEPRNR